MSHNPYQQYPGYPGTPPQGQGDYPASYPAPAPGYPQQQQGYYAGQQAPGYGAHPGQYQQHPGYEGINAPGYDYDYYDLYDNYGAYPGQDTAPQRGSCDYLAHCWPIEFVSGDLLLCGNTVRYLCHSCRDCCA